MSDDWLIEIEDYAGILVAVLYRRKAGGYRDRIDTIELTGFFAGPGMWFRSIERRTEIATGFLKREIAEIKARELKVAQMHWRAQVAARRAQGKG